MYYLQRLWRDTEKLLENFRSRTACGRCRGEGMEGCWERCPAAGFVEVRASESKEWLLEWDKKPVGKCGHSSGKESLEPQRGRSQVSEVYPGAVREEPAEPGSAPPQRPRDGKAPACCQFSSHPPGEQSTSSMAQLLLLTFWL